MSRDPNKTRKQRKGGRPPDLTMIRAERTEVATCLKCLENFQSFDKTSNRICPKCKQS